MSTSAPESPRSPWATRRARALRLAPEAPHAAEILSVYAELTVLQEDVASRVPIGRWIDPVRSEEVGAPQLRLHRLPAGELIPLFGDFIAEAVQVGPDPMRASAREWRDSPVAELVATLESALGKSPDTSGPFHVRAFVQAIATVLAGTVDRPLEGTAGRRCPICGGPPVVGVLQDLPDAQGSRALVCDICGSSWRVGRLVCAGCDRSDPDGLAVHTAETLPHVRLDACRSCRHYVKSVDLRRRGNAVPLVDDLATVELDLWAREQGMVRVGPNLFWL
ncbi:MAG TPA: formate dehydrogenase accessory protein FdhE [Longimicrobiales bacterium]|nr:formate dehydrogenase accessory protein FdhE [Longimicrobiales bacterium]